MISDLLPPEWRDRMLGGVVVGAVACFIAALVTWCAPDAPPAPTWPIKETPAAPNETAGAPVRETPRD